MSDSIIPYVSLCSGYEGIGLGLHRVIRGLRAVAYCEREAFACANLAAKIESGCLDAAPIFTDLLHFPWIDFAEIMAGGILSFGWPCQPVSAAGMRKGTEDERWLFDIICDGIALMRPGLLFAENVEGLLSAKMPDGSLIFAHCITRLESLGYRAKAGIFSAAEVGAPHQRKRVFILAHRIGARLEGLLGNGYGDNRQRRLSRTDRLDSGESRLCRECWPAGPGQEQYEWEPRRTVGNAIRGGKSQCGGERFELAGEVMANTENHHGRPGERGTETGAGQNGERRGRPSGRDGRDAEPALGGDADGDPCGLDYADLCVSSDNRIDELRLCGNGVVPATAERAFRVLWRKLTNQVI